jgi:hypothetical protein
MTGKVNWQSQEQRTPPGIRMPQRTGLLLLLMKPLRTFAKSTSSENLDFLEMEELRLLPDFEHLGVLVGPPFFDSF